MEAKIIKEEKKYMNLEEALRHAFEELLKAALDEMRRQRQIKTGESFSVFAEVKAENGQIFNLGIEVLPPTIPMIPSWN